VCSSNSIVLFVFLAGCCRPCVSAWQQRVTASHISQRLVLSDQVPARLHDHTACFTRGRALPFLSRYPIACLPPLLSCLMAPLIGNKHGSDGVVPSLSNSSNASHNHMQSLSLYTRLCASDRPGHPKLVMRGHLCVRVCCLPSLQVESALPFNLFAFKLTILKQFLSTSYQLSPVTNGLLVR